MSGYPSNTESIAADQLLSIVERIERLQEEIDDLNVGKADIYREARGNGFDVKVLRKVIAIRRQDHAERMEQEAILDLYLTALGSHVRARGDDE